MAMKKSKGDELPKVISRVDFQLGRTVKQVDRKLKALEPGKRKSKNNNVYYEYRKNRSDLKKNV